MIRSFVLIGCLALAILVIYTPFFRHYVPFIYYDSFLYNLLVDGWLNGEDFSELIHIDIPLGYPYFLYLCYNFDLSRLAVTLLQLSTFWIPFVLLLHSQLKKSWFLVLITALTSFVLFFSYDWLVHSITFGPDFLYSACIMWICYILTITKLWSTKRIIVLSIFVSLGVAIRSNGLLLTYFLLIPLFFGEKLDLVSRLKKIVFSFLAISIIFSAVSIFAVGYVAHGSPVRVWQKFFDKKTLELSKKRKVPVIDRFDAYFNPTSVKQTFFYNTALRNYMDAVYFAGKYQSDSITIAMSSGQDYYPRSTVNLTLGERHLLKKLNVDSLKDASKNLQYNNRNDFSLFHRLAMNIEFVQRSAFTPIKFLLYLGLFVAAVFYILNYSNKSKKMDFHNSAIFWALSFHLLHSIFILFFHPRPVMRYIMPTETVFFMLVPIALFNQIKIYVKK